MNEENQTIIKALNMFGRVPDQYELLNEIERLNNIINELEKYIKLKIYDIREQGVRYGLFIDKDIANNLDIRDETLEIVLDKLKELKESGNNE